MKPSAITILFCSAFLLATTGGTRRAMALGPVDVEVGVQAGVGTIPSNESSPNPLGFGIGGRAGVVFQGLYGGIRVMDYLGGSTSGAGSSDMSTSLSNHALVYGIEGGYGFKLLDMLTLRPQVGLGMITLSAKSSVSAAGLGPISETASESGFYIEPGVTALVPLGLFFVGADANVLLVPNLKGDFGDGHADVAFTLHGQVGVKF